MTRVEENKIIVDKMIKRAAQKPSGTYEEMVTFHLGTIATMLTDISKSLAVLADNADGAKDALLKVIDDIQAEINTPDRGTCDYFIVDRIEEIINEYKADNEE